MIEILVMQAIALHMQGDIPGALTPLKRALTLAEPDGYVRIFADEGQSMASLLEVAAQQGGASNYVHRLLIALGKADIRASSSKARAPRPEQPLSGQRFEPLSERERDVLRLLGSDLSGPDIARELMVSLNTLRTHTKNIYDKLEVNSRRAAVRRAIELDLL